MDGLRGGKRINILHILSPRARLEIGPIKCQSNVQSNVLLPRFDFPSVVVILTECQQMKLGRVRSLTQFNASFLHLTSRTEDVVVCRRQTCVVFVVYLSAKPLFTI